MLDTMKRMGSWISSLVWSGGLITRSAKRLKASLRCFVTGDAFATRKERLKMGTAKKGYETDPWPFIKARDYLHIKERRRIRLIVIHVMEAKESPRTAEDIGRYFQHPDKPSSTHVGVDCDSVVQYVRDNDVAYGAPGANSDGIHIELAGYSNQTQAQWLDAYGLELLENAADVTAQYCLKYLIPPRQLTNVQLLAGEAGIVGHDQVSKTYRRSDHKDPGPQFPWTYFLTKVNEKLKERQRLIA